MILRSSNPDSLIFWCVIGLCAGFYLFFNGFRLLQRRHLILDTPLSKIRSAPLGLVELNGLAVGPYTMTAPVTGRPCYYFRTLIWEYKQSGKNKQWVKVAAECMHVPFFVDDNTGKVMVDPRGADLDLHRDFQEEFCDSFFTTKEEVPPGVRELLLRHGIVTANKVKVEEYCIKPKNSLFLLGTLAENPGIDLAPQPIRDEENDTFTLHSILSFRSMQGSAALPAMALATGSAEDYTEQGNFSVSERLMGATSPRSSQSNRSMFSNSAIDPAILEEEFGHAAAARSIITSDDATPPNPIATGSRNQQEKIVAALQKAGVTHPAAWAAAGVNSPGVHAVNTSSASSSSGFDSHPAAVLMKGKNNPTFLISWRSQSAIASSLSWKCMLMIWGGPALALLSLYGLLTLTHLL